MKITISVKPNSGKSEIEELDDGSLVVRLKSAPVDGRANDELVRLLSKYFRVPQASICITHGKNGKKKMVDVLYSK